MKFCTGGEFVTTEKNPWYIGKAPVKYCIHASSEFSSDANFARETLALALKDWTDTILDLVPTPTPFKLPDGEQKNLTTQFSEVRCNEAPELQFYFGAFSPEVESALKSLARYTAAFAGHGDIDDNTGRVKSGIVWLAPDRGAKRYLGPATGADFWSRKQILYNVLLHEIGHIFGFDHQEDGVMNERFPSLAIRHDLPKSTTRRFVYHNWQERNLKICGRRLSLEDEFVRKVLNSNYVILWDVCLESKAGTDPWFRDLEVTFTSEKLIEKRTFQLVAKKDSIFSVPVRTVAGKYFESVLGSPAEYQSHTFLSLNDNRLSGYLMDSRGRYPFVFNKKGTRVELDIASGDELYDINYYVEDLRPNFDEFINLRAK